jgi:RNA polymerase sigma-70 factor (ECF subfamily)
LTLPAGLVEEARRGNPDAWRELYRATAGRLVIWLGTQSGSDGAIDPEDIAAEAWLTAARKIASFSGDESDFAGWLFGIARHIAANTRRRAGRRGTDPTADAGDLATGSLADHASVVVATDWVREVLAQLPLREREVLACLDVVGLDVAETSRVLEISASSVRVAHHRGLRRLRRLSDQGTLQHRPDGGAPGPGTEMRSPAPI